MKVMIEGTLQMIGLIDFRGIHFVEGVGLFVGVAAQNLMNLKMISCFILFFHL